MKGEMVERIKKNTVEQFVRRGGIRRLLTAHGIIDEAAIDDEAGYDGGIMLSRIIALEQSIIDRLA